LLGFLKDGFAAWILIGFTNTAGAILLLYRHKRVERFHSQSLSYSSASGGASFQ